MVLGSRDSLVVRIKASDLTLVIETMKGPKFESEQEWHKNFLLQGQLSVLNLISVSISPHVTAVASKTSKRSQSFLQKCRWLVAAKHTMIHTPYLYHIWL